MQRQGFNFKIYAWDSDSRWDSIFINVKRAAPPPIYQAHESFVSKIRCRHCLHPPPEAYKSVLSAACCLNRRSIFGKGAVFCSSGTFRRLATLLPSSEAGWSELQLCVCTVWRPSSLLTARHCPDADSLLPIYENFWGGRKEIRRSLTKFTTHKPLIWALFWN